MGQEERRGSELCSQQMWSCTQTDRQTSQAVDLAPDQYITSYNFHMLFKDIQNFENKAEGSKSKNSQTLKDIPNTGKSSIFYCCSSEVAIAAVWEHNFCCNKQCFSTSIGPLLLGQSIRSELAILRNSMQFLCTK